jgi:hypothetical protein
MKIWHRNGGNNGSTCRICGGNNGNGGEIMASMYQAWRRRASGGIGGIAGEISAQCQWRKRKLERAINTSTRKLASAATRRHGALAAPGGIANASHQRVTLMPRQQKTKKKKRDMKYMAYENISVIMAIIANMAAWRKRQLAMAAMA